MECFDEYKEKGEWGEEMHKKIDELIDQNQDYLKVYFLLLPSLLSSFLTQIKTNQTENWS